MSPFYQGYINDNAIGRRLKCPFCGEQQLAISNRRKHMRACPQNPKLNKEGIEVNKHD